ncbi:M13 family metallopeptidase [Hydrogenophaga sp.]|uniref:M13 family metallopeptidase n=1 Tax=Hydrogenophaga sp. TaxID=1904254 RepID=UPI0035B483A3
MNRPPFFAVAVASALLAPAAHAQAVPDFGYPAGFSVRKMDPTVSPRKDFTRYAAGRWHDALEIPGDNVRISGLDLMMKRTDVAVQTLVEEAAQKSATAPKGSPTQQVGALYLAGMDGERLKALGATPLQPQFERIAALRDREGVVREMARMGLLVNDLIMLGAGITPGIRDKTRYIMAVGDGELVLANFEDYLKPESARIREGLVRYVNDLMLLGGATPEEAASTAQLVLALETRVAKVRQPLVEHQDPDKRYVEMPYAQLKAQTPGFAWDAYFEVLGIRPPETVTAIELKAMTERSAAMAELSLDQLKTLLRWEYLRKSLGGLSADFTQPGLALTRLIYGPAFELPPRPKQVFGTIAAKLGHPLGQLYVEKNFSARSRRDVEQMVGMVRAEFRERLARNTWLTPATRKQALNKLDHVKITVGYPDAWIDHRAVAIRPDDYFGNLERLTEFRARRDLGRWGGPIKIDGFSDARTTLPTIVNAGYSPMTNGIEIPAAFLQPPAYDPKGDPAVNFCGVGAVIGHELTHGFDSGGRNYDEIGRARNWWVKADEETFVAQAKKLVAQANAYEVVPGLHANGALGVTENLADVGGIAFGYNALQKYLKAHPKENRVIDGLTQQQRCFISWAQMWSDKSREGYLRQVTATDAHAAGNYRAYAPAQHEPGFYKAFGIRKGDPMWLDPKDRVKLW